MSDRANPKISPRRVAVRIGAGLLLACLFVPRTSCADTPSVSYIFPAGGQRGTAVLFRVGGHFLHEECPFEMQGPGIEAAPTIRRTDTIWFEGPVIPLPDSQQKEDYPKDQAGSVKIAADAPLGVRHWRTWTSQGATASLKFVVGELPEIVEHEIDGDPIPTAVTLPLTINGRIFPREDVDVWTFEARAGQTITCEVLAARIGSPLESRLEVLDPHGRRVAEDTGSLAGDALVHFTAAEAGTYQVRIHDINFEGLQHYVYRLSLTAGPFVDRVYPLGGRRGSTTRFELAGAALPAEPVEIALPAEGAAAHWQRAQTAAGETNRFLLELDDLPEQLEAEPNDNPAALQPHSAPVVLNGRIGQPGDVDVWTIEAQKGTVLDCDLRAARLGSPLDAVLVILNADGKELARSDDISNTDTDSRIQFTPPADGRYVLRVEERLTSRGGPQFAYRLRVAPPPAADFRLRLPSDAITLNRGSQTNFKISAERLGGFAGEIELAFDGLPPGVTAANTKLAGNQNELQVTLKAEAAAKIQATRLQIRGTAKIGETPQTRTATLPAPRGESEPETVLLAIALPTPFKVKGQFESKYSPRGAVFVRHYTVDRGGYEGAFEVSLADRQFRHLQGVTGPTIHVPAGVSEFDYPLYLPPWMEIGRTCRAVVAAVGVIQEPDGTAHKVSYSSGEQSDQIIILVDPGPLSLDLARESLLAAPGKTVEIPVLIGRGQSLGGLPVKVELVPPQHLQGVKSEPITLQPNETKGTLSVRFGPADRLGPFNMPIIVRAIALPAPDRPVIAETKVEFVSER
jgi:hypothetical protein